MVIKLIKNLNIKETKRAMNIYKNVIKQLNKLVFCRLGESADFGAFELLLTLFYYSG